MKICEKEISKFFEADCVPLSKNEILEPTRVVWKKCGTITTKIFPTKQRAWDFALSIENLVEVQKVEAKVPEQDVKRKIGNLPFSSRILKKSQKKTNNQSKSGEK